MIGSSIHIRGVSTGEKLQHWEVLLEEWCFLIERYCRITNGEEYPFAFTERANVGILSGAAWRTGRIALEEFQDEKCKNGQKGQYGRVDLWMSGDEMHYPESGEFIEAKYKEIKLFEKNENLEPVLKAAYKDAKDSQNKDSEIDAIGVAFFPLWVNKSNFYSQKDQLSCLGTFIEKIKNIDSDAMAFCFPQQCLNSEANDKGNIYPGIVLLAKKV